MNQNQLKCNPDENQNLTELTESTQTELNQNELN